MRFASLAVIASLVAAPGCAVLAVPPLIGAGIGLATSAGGAAAGYQTSPTRNALIGAAVGAAVDAILIGVVAYQIDRSLHDGQAERGAR